MATVVNAAKPTTQAKSPAPNLSMFAAFLSKIRPPMNMNMGSTLPMGAAPNGNTGIAGGLNLGTGNMPQLPNMPNGNNPFSYFGNQETSIDDFGNKYGFDYSKNYALEQANAIEQAKQNALNSQLKQVQSGVEGSVNNIDRGFYQNMLQQSQSQVNGGLNAGIAADQNLRLAMNRQNAMGDIYRDANNQSANINSQLGQLDAEKIAYADQLYNDRRQQAYQNTQQYNQLSNQNASTYADYMRNVTNDNRSYALQEGQLMGNYVPYEARGLIQTVLNAKDQLSKTNNPLEQQQLINSSNNARIQLASMGVNVDTIGTTSTFNNAMNSIHGMNKTMDGQNNDMNLANQVAANTGVFTDPRAQSLYQTLLGLKSQAAQRGGATTNELNQMNQIQGQLAGMGVNATKLIGNNVTYGNALKNASGLGTQTLASKLQSANITNQKAQTGIDLLHENNTYKLGQGQNANDARKIGNDYSLGQTQNANQATQIANDYNVQKEKNTIDKQLNSYNYSIAQGEQDIKKAQTEIDLSKVQWEKQSASDKASAKSATDAVVSELLGKSKAEAIASFGKYYKNWISQGVDVVGVMDALGLTGLLKPSSTKNTTTKDPLGDYFKGK